MYIKITEYNPAWKQDFEMEKKKLEKILPPINIKIEHIGGTAVEGLKAKPIIDILIGVESPILFDSIVSILGDDNYIYYSIYNSKYPDRRHMVKTKEKHDILEIQNLDEDVIDKIGLTRIFHINIAVTYSHFWNRHLFFREMLRHDKSLMEKYSQLKIDLAKKKWKSMEDYSDAKTEFIREVEKKIHDPLFSK